MEKLTIKHIAPYLPYELEAVDYYNGGRLRRKINNMNIMAFVDGDINAKPILKPLSQFGDSDDIRKVHKFIGLGKWCDAYDGYFKFWFDDAQNIDNLVLQAPYEIFQYFLANHYDVFSLIPKGLAVDANTL